MLKDPENSSHVEKGSRKRDCQNNTDSLHQLPCTGILDPQKNMIGQIRDDQDFYDIRPSHGGYTELGNEYIKRINPGNVQDLSSSPSCGLLAGLMSAVPVPAVPYRSPADPALPEGMPD